MNFLDVITKVKDHLLKQNEKCVVFNPFSRTQNCVYRDGARACAIGALINDRFYSTHIEKMAACSTPVMEAVISSLGIDASKVDIYKRGSFGELLGKLQCIHDGVDPNEWELHLNELYAKIEWNYLGIEVEMELPLLAVTVGT